VEGGDELKYLVHIGAKFERWTVVERVANRNGFTRYKCLCDCGTEGYVNGIDLLNGRSKKCRYCNRKKEDAYARTPLYQVWQSMKQRCFNENDHSYKNYGGRGIAICDEWLDFLAFREWSYANGYQKGLSIDRINNDEGYNPGNCRWTTQKVQCNNKRTVHWITYNGETKTLSEWAASLGLKPHSLLGRLSKYPVEVALSIKKTNGGRCPLG
jgi:hypothetical protein